VEVIPYRKMRSGKSRYTFLRLRRCVLQSWATCCVRGESVFDTTRRPIRLSGHDARADAGLFDTPSHLFLRTQRRHHLSRPNTVLTDLRLPASTSRAVRKNTIYKDGSCCLLHGPSDPPQLCPAFRIIQPIPGCDQYEGYSGTSGSRWTSKVSCH